MPLFTRYAMRVELRDRQACADVRLAIKAFSKRLKPTGRDLALQNRIFDIRMPNVTKRPHEQDLITQMRAEETFVYITTDTMTLHLRHVSDHTESELLFSFLAKSLEPFTDRPFFLEHQASNADLPTRVFFALSLADVPIMDVVAQVDDAIARLPKQDDDSADQLRRSLLEHFTARSRYSLSTTDIEGAFRLR